MATTPTRSPQPPSLWLSLRSLLGIGSVADWLFKQVCQASGLVVIFVVVLIVVLLYDKASPAIDELGWSILQSSKWDPNPPPPDNPDPDAEEDPNAKQYTEFGALTFIYGSVMTSALAMLLAVPLAVGTATFLSEIASPMIKRGGSFFVEMLAAIPSVVYGFWGVNFLAPGVQHLFDRFGGPHVNGKCILSASLVLAVMVLPYITAVSFDVCQAVPRAQREGALALGSTRWQTIWKVVLPYARPGIIGGCFLGLGRAIGETLAVTIMIGDGNTIRNVLYPGATIPHALALKLPATTNGSMHQAALLELALMLFGVTIVMNVLARLLIWRVGRVRRRSPLGTWFTPPRVLALVLGVSGGFYLLGRIASLSGWVVSLNRLLLVGAIVMAVLAGLAQLLGLVFNRRARLANSLMTGILATCLVIACSPLFVILGYIAFRGIGFQPVEGGGFEFHPIDWVAFFTSTPEPDPTKPGGGLANALVGSLEIVGLASLLAIPVGLLAAIFLAEYRRSRAAPVLRFFGELLTGVPSIVIGTFVFVLIDLLMHLGKLASEHEISGLAGTVARWVAPAHQFSGWAGAFALAVMMVPIVMRASEEALNLVPSALRNASHALGAHHWQTVVRVCVPAALSAIITAVFLAVSRIAGETAPLLMTAFGNDNVTFSPSDPMATVPKYIFDYSMEGTKAQEPIAWAAALVLLAFVMLLNVGIRVLTGKRVVLASRAE
jgi:phosphate transport system permease protein